MATAHVSREEDLKELVDKMRAVVRFHLTQLDALQHGHPYEGVLLKPAEIMAVATIWRAIKEDQQERMLEHVSPLAHLPDEIIRRMLVRAAPQLKAPKT